MRRLEKNTLIDVILIRSGNDHEGGMRRHIANGRDDLFIKKAGMTTLAAWEPYWEVLGIYFSFNHQECDDEHPEWRMMWLSQVTLLRVIGHVLAKVDAETSTAHKDTINAKWGEWKAHRADNWVFWDFIEDERNNLLKAYQFGVEVDGQGLFHEALDIDGHLLLRESIYWWRDQLEEIEATTKFVPGESSFPMDT